MKKMFTRWESVALLWALMLTLPFAALSQTCGTTWYDSGGPNGNYQNNEDITTTFCPDNVGDVVTVTFITFATEQTWDKLYVHNGPDTSFPLIASTLPGGSGPCTTPGGWWGEPGQATYVLPGPFTSTHESGCLTFRFCSDGSVVRPGWEALVGCAPAPNCTPPVINYVQNERDCDDLSFSVTANITAPSVPSSAPLLIATAIVNGNVIPEVGGIISNTAGSSLEIGPLPLDVNVIIEISVLGFSCPTTALFSEVSNGCPIPLTCGEPLETTYCYGNNENTPFLWQSPDGEPIVILFQSGQISTFGDAIALYDGVDNTGTLLFSGSNNGILTGLNAVAESGSLYMVVTSDGFTSCQAGSFAGPWTWIVGCNIDIEGCTDPEALNFQPVANVDNGSCLFNGNICSNAIVVGDLPYTSSANTNLFGNDYVAANVPPLAPGAIGTGGFSNFYLNGDDVVYEYTPDADGFIDISATQTTTRVGLWVFTGCPFAATVGFHTGFDANGRFVNQLPVSAGVTYYVVISTWPAPQSTPYTLNIQNTVFDCPDLNANIGSICNTAEIDLGQVSANCVCEELDFEGCTNGVPFGSANPTCTNPTVQIGGAWNEEYSTITVLNGGLYTFSITPSGAVPFFFITLTNATGTEVIGTGVNTLVWSSPLNGTIRMYTHSTPLCIGGVTGGESSHTRIVSLNCDNLVYDCQDLSLNIGDACTTSEGFGLVDADCECDLIDFTGCTNGVQFGSAAPTCATPVVTIFGSWNEEFSPITVQNGGTYTFSTTENSNVPVFYITITNATGTSVITTGVNSVVWQANLNGNVRMYTHSTPTCFGGITGGLSSHSRIISLDCSTLIYDCQDLQLNFGAPCDLGGEFGLIDEDCECGEIEFIGCTEGFQAFAVATPNCNGTPTNITFVSPGSYNQVNVQNGGVYTFTHSTIAATPFFFITITNSLGNQVLAAGVQSVTWAATYTGVVRFYTHVNIDCTAPVGVFTHTRTVSVNCDNLIYDCQELELDFGDICTQDGGEIGSVNEDCECGEFVFAGCTNGTSFGTQTANCSGVPTQTLNSWVNEYTTVNNILNGGVYTFSTTANAAIPFFYVTITDATGSQVLAAGIAPLTWTSTFNGSVRFFTHGSPDCGGTVTGSASSHTRIVTANCDNLVTDCPDLGLNFGAPCDDGNPNTINDVVTLDCTCEGIIPPAGNDCNNPLTVSSLPYTNANNTANFFDTYSSTELPPQAPGAIGTGGYSGVYMNGNDAVYTYTPTENQLLNVTLSPGHGTWAGLFAFTGCPFTSGLGYHTGDDGNGRSILDLPVTAGTTYYFFVSSWPAPQTIAYTILISVSTNVVDCPDLNLNIGAPCNDGNPATINDVVNANCECVGEATPMSNCGDYTSSPSAPFGSNAAVITDLITVSGTEGVLTNLKVAVDISHVWMSDVEVRLISPAGTEIDLVVALCGNGQDMIVFFDDNAGALSCSPSIPALLGTYAPQGSLAAFIGEDFNGDWTLEVTDNFSFIDDGVLNSWCLVPALDGGPEPDPTVFEIIAGSENHNTLEAALVAAELDGVLDGEGTYTVFAPTDAAFDALPDGLLTDLLADPSGLLTDILLYHVVGYTALSTDVTDGEEIQTIHGDMVTVTINAEGVFINDAQIIIADIIASNGVVHVIDAVLIPAGEPLPTIFEIVAASDVHNTLEAALIAAELDGVLSGVGTFTLFAPTDAAFDALPDGLLTDLLDDPSGLLTDILLYHVVGSTALSTDLSDGQVIQTLNGQSVTVTINGDGIFINDAQVIIADILASNGVVHVIDAVLVPSVVPPGACEEATVIAAAPTFAESEIPVSAGTTPSGLAQCQNAANAQPDQWFAFQSVATVMYVRAWGLNDYDAAVEVYDACGGQLLACQNTAPAGEREIVILQTTTPGETYYFRVYHGGTGTPATTNYTVAVAHIPFTRLRPEDCNVFNYTPAGMIRTELPPNQFLLTNWYFEFTELEAPFNTYEILSPNGSNPNFLLQWFPQAQYGRTYSVRTRARMYQGPNWGDYGDACTIGFSAQPLTTQLKESMALGFYNMCDILEADNVPGAIGYRWRIQDGFTTIIHETPNRFLPLQDVPGLNLGSPYAVRVRARTLGVWAPFGLTRLFAMNNFVPETGVDAQITACGGTYPLTQVLSAVEICAAEFYTWRFTNLTDANQPDLFYTRDDGLRTISLSWVTGLIPGHTYAVQVLGGSGGLTGTYGFSCNITIAGGSGIVQQPHGGDAMHADISLYPNPSRGDEVMVTVGNLTDSQNQIIIEVYDMYGKKVHSQNFANNGGFMNAPIRFQKPVAAGIYTVNIISNDEVVGARKLVVQK